MGKTGDFAPNPDPEAFGSGKVRDRLGWGRLVIALDALLAKRNVTSAARDLGIQTPALSRLLGQLRDEFGDPLFVRSGRGLVPTPFVEALRPKIRAIAVDIDALFKPGTNSAPSEMPFDPRWNVPTDSHTPPLRVRPADPLDVANSNDTPSDRLARHIGVLGIGGGGHGRPLTVEESEDAMAIILAGEADPVQIGALLGMMRMRGSTAPEIAGFVRAMSAHVAGRLGRLGQNIEVDVDWPCFTSPNYHNPPWVFHAAILVAQAGHRVLLHGSTGVGPSSVRHEVVASALAIPVCKTTDDIPSALARSRIAYAPLAALAPQIHQLVGLYRLMQTRSAVLEAVHLLKPAGGRITLLGVAKPSYRDLHRDAARLVGWKNLAVLSSARDVAQFTPFRPTTIHRLVNGDADDLTLPALMREPPATPRPRGTNLDYWEGVWTGAIRDTRAERIIVGTAAFALFSIPGGKGLSFDEAMGQAEALWKARRAV